MAGARAALAVGRDLGHPGGAMLRGWGNRGIMYCMAYRILIPSLVLCLLLVGGMLVLERTGLIEIDEKAIQPEVVSCQVGHNDMKVRVQGGNGAAYRGEVVPRYKFWLPPFGGCAFYYWDRPKAG
jgi:hypothetical protein